MPHLLVVFVGLDDAIVELHPQFGCCGAVVQQLLAANQFTGLLEDTGGSLIHQPVEGAAHRRVSRDSTIAVGTAADGAYHEVFPLYIRCRNGCNLPEHLAHADESFIDRRLCASIFLDDNQGNGSPAVLYVLLQTLALEVLTTQRHQQHGTHIGMSAELLHHPLCIVVGRTTAESYQMDILVLIVLGNTCCHMMGTLYEVGDHHDVADAFPPVVTKKAFHSFSFR